MIQRISAVTLATRDMARSVAFYQAIGFALDFGGADAEFTTMRAGDAFINLIAATHYTPHAWGRAIIRVESADAMYERCRAVGLTPEAPPRDAEWGERYFHLADPDGHGLSFAEPLPGSG